VLLVVTLLALYGSLAASLAMQSYPFLFGSFGGAGVILLPRGVSAISSAGHSFLLTSGQAIARPEMVQAEQPAM
jgi:hypothetical protein